MFTLLPSFLHSPTPDPDPTTHLHTNSCNKTYLGGYLLTFVLDSFKLIIKNLVNYLE